MTARLSTRAMEAGITNLHDAKLVFLRQAPVWWLGNRYHCPVCGVDFISVDDAARHVVERSHPVLRGDAAPFVGVATQRRGAG
ncbi:MAG: hypothetical protein HYY04_14435 [Chloroflexi bacterium]|nr:hypothetical protein [Chloroflexota bacterium]